MKTILFLLIFSCYLSFSASAQQSGSITGTVTDKNTQMPLSNVSIRLDGNEFGTISDSLGNFRIRKIPVGTYNILISSLGYKDVTIFNSIVTSGNENTFAIELELEASQLNEVIISSATVRTATLETPAASTFRPQTGVPPCTRSLSIV